MNDADLDGSCFSLLTRPRVSLWSISTQSSKQSFDVAISFVPHDKASTTAELSTDRAGPNKRWQKITFELSLLKKYDYTETSFFELLVYLWRTHECMFECQIWIKYTNPSSVKIQVLIFKLKTGCLATPTPTAASPGVKNKKYIYYGRRLHMLGLFSIRMLIFCDCILENHEPVTKPGTLPL